MTTDSDSSARFNPVSKSLIRFKVRYDKTRIYQDFIAVFDIRKLTFGVSDGSVAYISYSMFATIRR